MITFSEIIIKLVSSENEDHKCPYCWAATKDSYCEECQVNIEQIELI